MGYFTLISLDINVWIRLLLIVAKEEAFHEEMVLILDLPTFQSILNQCGVCMLMG